MKLHRLFAAFLALALVISASPFGAVHAVTEETDESGVAVVAEGQVQNISAVNTDYVLRSAAVKYTEGANFVERGVTDGIYGDDPRIDTLLTAAVGQFNKSGEEWPWIAYQVNVPTAGTYTLGVQTNSCKWADFKLPMVVNGKVYTLTYTAKAQTQTAQVVLPAGEHVVTVFWPMPANESEIYPNADWNNYLWCNIQSVVVDSALTVSKTTAAAVEAAVAPKSDTVISAVNTGKVLRSAAVGDNGNGYLEFNSRDAVKADLPYIETLKDAAPGEFNKPGEEWGWFAYKVSAPAEGTYTLALQMQNCRNAPYYMPLYVNQEVYTLSYGATGRQKATVDVKLPAGEHTVVMFMPMPINASGATGQDWVDYPWCNPETITVDAELSVLKPTAAEVEACFPAKVKEDTIISAVDTNYMIWSASVDKKFENVDILYCKNSGHMRWDKPTIETLHTDAVGQFNASDGEWLWFAYKVNAAADGIYTLGVKVNNVNLTGHANIPLCVNGEVYTLKYTEAPQQVTQEVALPAGEHTVVMFMPMPEKRTSDITNNGTYYPWCNVESMIVDADLTPGKPTVAEVEAVFAPQVKENTVVSAVDTDQILLSATIKKNAAALGRTDQATLKVDAPSIETLYTDAFEQFNKTGEEWNWFAYKVTVPAEGTYTLGVKTAGSKVASYQIPMCVGGQVYALQYTEKTQAVTTEVTLPAGEHVVVVFMPMPAAKANITGNEWNDYHWCDVESISVPAGMKVSKPTAAEVEACFPDPVGDSPLTGKRVLFVGDSITHASFSWASVIGKAYRMDWTNSGISGATISDLREKIIRHQLMLNADKDYDYVIMHGGINDAMSSAPIGSVSGSFNVADFDAETYIGGLETLFYYAYENFPGAKFGYIINYATPNSKFGGCTAGDDTKAYYEAAKMACDKWGIPYIDLYSGSTADGKSYSFDILQVDKAAENFINNDPNEIHLSAAGYNLISPYIAKWMETFTVNSKPAGLSGAHIDANDADKVLYSNFTPKSENLDWTVNVGLVDRVYTGMAADNANIEFLPYAKDMLGNWAFASIAVDVPADGAYSFKVEMAAKVPYQMGMLADSEVYTLKYGKRDGAYEFMEQTVNLTKGIHYITFTAAMPNNDNELDGDAWNLYPWTNIAAIVVDEGVEVLAKPTLEEVTSKLSAFEPLYTRVEAENTEYVIYNNYNTTNEANAKASGGQVVGGAWTSTYKQTFEELEVWMNAKGNAYVEYAVVAPADGEYEIRVGFLAGSNDKTIAKPYIAVIVNDTTYRAQFTKNWNQIDKVKMTVTLKEGVNIIRCSSMTIEQEIYGVKGWINQDFLDLDKRLTPIKHSAVVVEAENARYYNRLTVQAGGKDEAASGKVLGNSDRKYVKGLWATLDQFSNYNLKQIPWVSVTVTAPQNGYYPISVNMAGDGRLKQSTVGMIVDGWMTPVTYVRTDKTTAGAKVDVLVYLTAGDHVVTFTTPIPANADVNVQYSYLWANFDYITLYDGLTLAQKQIPPTYDPDYVRVEMEEIAISNLSSSNGTAIGNAYYKSAQTVQEMLENGIDSSRTPYTEFTVHAARAGNYSLYIGVSAGMTGGSTWQSVGARLVAEVNGKMQVKTVLATKSTEWTVIPLYVKLEEGENTIRLTHLGSDSHRGGTTWIDFDYIEMHAWNAANLEFGKAGIRLEAEKAKYSGFAEMQGSSYSDGRYLGRANYDTVAEVNITHETLDPADLSGLPYVTYRIIAEKEGTYPVAVGFGAGLTNYPAEEYQQGIPASFTAIVNGETKQRVEFTLASPSTTMARVILLELKEGENEVTFTGTTSEYVVDRIPRNDETYRLVWIDQDYLVLSEGLSNLGQEAEPFDVEESGYDFGQLAPKDPTEPTAGAQDTQKPDTTAPVQEPAIPTIVWILSGIGLVFVLFVILLLTRKRKKDEKA